MKDVTITEDIRQPLRLDESKFIDRRFEKDIRIDQTTHLQGRDPPHAHVFGRKGEEVVVVNFDGTRSHGSKGRLHAREADALRSQGFDIRADRIVEWWILPDVGLDLLLG